MACVRYRFKSSKEFESIPIFGNFISVADLKHLIAESARFGKGKDFDLRFSDAQTGEEYANDAALIPKQSSVLVQRIPGPPRERIVIPGEERSKETKEVDRKIEGRPLQVQDQATNSSTIEENGSVIAVHDFGNQLFSEPSRSGYLVKDDTGNLVIDDEDIRIRALVSTPVLDYSGCTSTKFGRKLVSGRRSQARNLILEDKTPPEGYVCHRCGVPGHFIHHCPTNGDPSYDKKRLRPPTGVPKSTQLRTAVTDDEAFEREMEGLPSTQRKVTELPPELLCPLCKAIMDDAVLTSKCCFSSFCDKCIRDYVISKLSCVCGANNVMADDLIPNKTLRETIRRFSQSSSTISAGVTGSYLQALDVEPACPVAKAPTSTASTITQSSALLPNVAANEVKIEAVKVNDSEGYVVQSLQKDISSVENEISGHFNPTIYVPQKGVSLPVKAHDISQSSQQAGESHHVRKSSKKKAIKGSNLMVGSDMDSCDAYHAGRLWTSEGSFYVYPGTVPCAYMPNVYGFAPPGGSSLAVAPYWSQADAFCIQTQANVFCNQMQANAMQDLSWRQSFDGSRIKVDKESPNISWKNNVCFLSVTPV